MVKDLIPNGLHGLYDRQNRIEGLVVPKKVLVVNPTEELLLGLVMVGVEELYLYQFGYIEEFNNLKKLRPYLDIINIKTSRYENYDYSKIRECILINSVDKVIYNITNNITNQNILDLFGITDSFSKTYVLFNSKVYYNYGVLNLEDLDRKNNSDISIYLLLHTMFYEKDFEHYYSNNISFSIDSNFVIDRIINDVKKNFEFIKKRNNFGDISIDFHKKIEREHYDSTYHIIGAGGIGYNVKDVVKNNYTKTYDMDKIELSNLSRLPVGVNEVGEYKANNRQEILGLSYLSDEEELNNYDDEKDVVIDCRDNLNPRKLHRKTAFKLSYDGGKMFGIYLRPQDTLVDSIQFNQTSVTEDTYTTDPSYFIMPRLLSFIGLELLEYDFIKNTNRDEYKDYKISMNLIYNLSDIIKENVTILGE
jgi:hypothetical protein